MNLKTKKEVSLITDQKIQSIVDKIQSYGWGNNLEQLAIKVIGQSTNINEKDSRKLLQMMRQGLEMNLETT